jgi:hypothetical protein
MPNDYKYESTYGERDPKTGQFQLRRSKAWESAQGKKTGDFDGFSDYGSTTTAEEMKKAAMGHGGEGVPGGRRNYGVSEGDQ